MAKSIQQILVANSYLTDFTEEDEPYILTKEEEDKIIAAVVESKKSQYMWKMKRIAKTEEEIIIAAQKIDWYKDIDRQAILKRANSIKHHDAWQKEQREKEKQAKIDRYKQLVETWTAKRIYQLMSWSSSTLYDTKLEVNEGNRRFITALCFFVSRDDRFMSELGYDPQKGLLIRGATGIGKTFLVQCIKNNELNPIKIESMLDITEQMRDKGSYQIDMGECKLLYFDDVGTEEAAVKNYGTNLMFFKNFIENYYLKHKTFNTLMVSTNLNFKAMTEVYGFRVVSRLRDMFNVIDVSGKDMRG